MVTKKFYKREKMDKDILKSITILYVEDDKETREIYQERLSKKVKKLYIASNGQEGYDQYIQNKPDIIITDIKMPVVDGIDMVRKVRERDSQIPIIITTAHNTIDYLTDSLNLDITGYLIKPINNKQLYTMLENRAKIVLAKKEEKSKYSMLQAIINADSHMLVVTDLSRVIFANNTYLNFFNTPNVEEFNKKYESFIDIFMPQEGFIDKSHLKDGEDFMELMLRTQATKRNVMIFDFNRFVPKSFYLKLTPIDRRDNKDIYLATFIDISLMTMEKLELQNKVYFDNLTNIYNRNKIDEVFQSELEKANRYETQFSMILVDIDHFKSFNDTFGHLIGDEVLILLAQTINKITRKTDTFARWGGEEFVMILPNTTKENAAIVAEHLRGDVAKIKHEVAGGITASFGVCEFSNGDTEEIMYKKCDEALYKAKENGRNRVEVYENLSKV